MHTFHLHVGEVTITLQDIAMMCLPLIGAPVGPIVVPGDWEDQVLHRFQGVFQLGEGDATFYQSLKMLRSTVAL